MLLYLALYCSLIFIVLLLGVCVLILQGLDYLGAPDLIMSVFLFPAAITISIAGGIRSFLYCYRPSSECKHEYRRIVFMWTILLFGSLYCYMSTAQNVSMVYAPFQGYQPISSPQVVRVIIYVLAFAQLLVLKSSKRIIQNHFGMKQRADALRGIKVWIFVKGTVCILPAIYGLCLFLANGFYRDLYMLVGYSAALGVALFPRYKEWKGWLVI
jgi:hypothetical protein